MALGDRTESRLYGPITLPTTAGTLTNSAGTTTVPASRVYVVKQITICNTGGVDATVDLALVPTGDSVATKNYFMKNIPSVSKDTLVFDTGIVMSAGDSLYGKADYDGVNIIAVGWVKEV